MADKIWDEVAKRHAEHDRKRQEMLSHANAREMDKNYNQKLVPLGPRQDRFEVKYERKKGKAVPKKLED